MRAASRTVEDESVFPVTVGPKDRQSLLNTSFANLPAIQNMEEVGLPEVSVTDARSREIAHDDRAWHQPPWRRSPKARVNGAVQAGSLDQTSFGLS